MKYSIRNRENRIWLYLVFARGWFWWLRDFDDDFSPHPELTQWPHVVAIVPARNEAEVIGPAIDSLVRQQYPGEFSIVVVDDHSADGTAENACAAAAAASARVRVTVHSAAVLPSGWTGKLWALNEGVAHATAMSATYYWFTDADITHAPDTLRRLVSRAQNKGFSLTSLMALLRAETPAERWLIPPFLYFFLKLYPPKWIADAKVRTAGAAGGCILLRRSALERIGGLAAIRGEVIDDCALARAVKRSGSAIWMGVTRASVSLRSYGSASEIRNMIARTAFTELRYSSLLLFGTILGMLFIYITPIVLLFSSHLLTVVCGIFAWVLMTVSFTPTLWHFRQSRYWAPLLSLAALFYSYATLVSALRYWRGCGAQWKGRSQAQV